MSISRENILQKFDLLRGKTGGIESWLTPESPNEVFERLCTLDESPLSLSQFNQLLVLSHEAHMGSDFFDYYWLTVPANHHPYDVTRLPDYQETWRHAKAVYSLDHLYWGFYRLYVDGLLYFGNIRTSYRFLRNLSKSEMEGFFLQKRYDTQAMCDRGRPLPLVPIPKDNRYLISEMACKSYGVDGRGDLKVALDLAYQDHNERVGGRVTAKELLNGTYVQREFANVQQQLLFSADEILDEELVDQADLNQKFERIATAFTRSREAALMNTRYYLSMVNDLDVYVATSMRTRADFRLMADLCDRIFEDGRLQALNLRYFDPTLSAAEGHEDKGLIECLMVKCAKVLVYCGGEKESYGKDAEAAMALSQGKPVIFYSKERAAFYRDVHPLTRLIDFQTGVPVGVTVTDKCEQIPELLRRIFENKMEYELEQPKPGYFRLREKLTQSVVRLQTSDDLLRETFWNYYHNRPHTG